MRVRAFGRRGGLPARGDGAKHGAETPARREGIGVILRRMGGRFVCGELHALCGGVALAAALLCF